jgi:hypothetical protein
LRQGVVFVVRSDGGCLKLVKRWEQLGEGLTVSEASDSMHATVKCHPTTKMTDKFRKERETHISEESMRMDTNVTF